VKCLGGFSVAGKSVQRLDLVYSGNAIAISAFGSASLRAAIVVRGLLEYKCVENGVLKDEYVILVTVQG
jgi:hypothetical protein